MFRITRGKMMLWETDDRDEALRQVGLFRGLERMLRTNRPIVMDRVA